MSCDKEEPLLKQQEEVACRTIKHPCTTYLGENQKVFQESTYNSGEHNNDI